MHKPDCCDTCDNPTVSVISLTAITDSISCDILHQLLVPIYNRSALRIVFGERIAIGRASCHSLRIESLWIAYGNLHDFAREPVGDYVPDGEILKD